MQYIISGKEFVQPFYTKDSLPTPLTRLLIPNNKISQRLELRVLVPEVSHPLFGISTNKEHRHDVATIQKWEEWEEICQSLPNPRAHAMPMMMTYVLSSN